MRCRLFDVPEADWKRFRKLREIALDRFCERVLREVEAAAAERLLSNHERYRAVFSVVERRDRELAEAFDDPRRSTMLVQLSLLARNQLLEPRELAQFSSETRARLERIAEVLKE